MARSSGEYWEERVAGNIWKTYNSLEERNRDLLDFYTDASKRIKDELYSIAEKHSKDGVLSLSDMHKQNRLSELNRKYEQIAEELGHQIEKAAVKNMQEGYKKVYADTAKGLGENDFSMPNKKLMEKMLNEPWRGDNFERRLWKNQKRLAVGLNNILLSGLQQGKTVTEMAVQLHNFTGNNFNDCHRLVRTESMHYLNSAAQQRYKDSGIAKVRVWAALDERTCSDCMKYHDKVYPIDKAPILPAHPNCRCTFLPEIEDHFSEDSIIDNAIIKSDINALKVPDKVYKASGMTCELKQKIENAVEVLQKEYEIKLGGCLATSLGNGNESAFFGAVPYYKNERDIGFALVINTDYDYNNFEEKIEKNYKNGLFAGKTVDDYILHEMSHIMTFQDCKTDMEYNNIKRLVNTYFVSGISRYADAEKSGTECIAEAAVRMCNGEKVPPEIRGAVKYYIERWKR